MVRREHTFLRHQLCEVDTQRGEGQPLLLCIDYTMVFGSTMEVVERIWWLLFDLYQGIKISTICTLTMAVHDQMMIIFDLASHSLGNNMGSGCLLILIDD